MRRALAIVTLLLAGACSRAGDEEAQSKRAPIAEPPGAVPIPATLRIPVEVDGVAAAAVTGAQLAALAPDFADADRRAWRLTRVLGAAFDHDGAVVEAVGREGVSISMPRPPTMEDLQPVLFLTRRGDLVATLVRPEKPFPDYHGQGGRLRRPGDTTPRVTPVVELRVHSHAPSP